MGASAAFLLLQSVTAPAQAPASPPAFPPLIQLFVSACIEGQFRPLPGSFRELGSGEVPRIIRQREGDWTYVEILHPERALLAFGSERRSRPYYSRMCQMKVQGLDAREVLSTVVPVVTGREFRSDQYGQPAYYQFDNFEENYRFVVSAALPSWVPLTIGHIGPGAEREFRARQRIAQTQARRARSQNQESR